MKSIHRETDAKHYAKLTRKRFSVGLAFWFRDGLAFYMTSQELRSRFLKFFEQRGHAIVPSSSLLPDDPSVLLTTAGMQQFKKYYTGELDPMTTVHPNLGRPLGARSAASIQKSFRTSDIDEVGDESHLTFFEMLGNFSFGGYFKQEAIKLAWEFLTSILPDLKSQISNLKNTSQNLKIYVTVFGGDEEVPRDEESYRIWRDEIGLPEELIQMRGREDNFWGPTGKEGPCGPTTEIYLNGVEVWNIVFNEYYCKADKTLEKLEKPGVDTGMGLERLAMIVQKTGTIFETDLFAFLSPSIPGDLQIKRIIADHMRGAAFLLADGLRPSNKEAGYVLRRLIRRSLIKVYQSGINDLAKWSGEIVSTILGNDMYKQFYPELVSNRRAVLDAMRMEAGKFSKTLSSGLALFKREELSRKEKGEKIQYDVLRASLSGEEAFKLFSTHGIPFEQIQELAKESGMTVDKPGFDEEFRKHQELSRAGREAKFGGHGLLLDTGELRARDEEELKKVTRLHTATHLLQAALRAVLGESVHQDGSDITAERLRFDFTLDRRLTDEELKRVEDWVNDVVRKDVPMEYKELPFEEAKNAGALYFAKEKYPATVKVYSAYDPITGMVYSRELCGGPHVTHTGEVGHFRILKQEAVGAGVRRIRATVTP